ncbi:MAG TPA: hypothetical protein VN420_02215 [Candidatus Fimivivens sp.]|nr:hypothetical protein [Candidatus Fimivivens sp.]
MLPSKKTFIVPSFVAIALLGVIVFSYPVIRDGYFSGIGKAPAPAGTSGPTSSVSDADDTVPNASEETGSPGNDSDAVSDTSSSSISPSDTSPTSDAVGTASIDVNSRDGSSGSVLANVSNDQCQSACKAYANDLSLLEYCQQVCGLAPIKTVTSSDCSKKSGIQKDYCYKDLAMTRQDISVCDKIKDTNIKKTCSTRITQDIIEGL